MTDVLYEWPPAAAFGRRLAKETFYKHGSVSSALRERFVTEVASIEWAFKLAESTINLPGSLAVPEVQVLRITSKDGDVSDHVLAAIDSAVVTPIVFEVLREDEAVRMAVAARKSSGYHSTPWLPQAHARSALPTAINLSTLYIGIIESLLPIRVHAGEGPAELAARLQSVAKLEREIAAIERRLRNEPQLNRKLELRRSLTVLKTELETQR